MDENKIVIYQTEDGQTQIDVRLENDTVWLTQAQMVELFQKDQSVVARHINNAFREGELDDSNMHFLHNTQYKRRFLYKIKFEKPTVEARMSMWHEMIPVLKEDETKILATKYDFSGGQIENIARHYTIDSILHGTTDNVLETLSLHCDSERIEKKTNKKIGFR